MLQSVNVKDTMSSLHDHNNHNNIQVLKSIKSVYLNCILSTRTVDKQQQSVQTNQNANNNPCLECTHRSCFAFMLMTPKC